MVDDVATIPVPGLAKRPNDTNGGASVRYVLEHFLAGPENALVGVAVRSVLNDRTGRFNPLMWYGPKGTGKSHLACGMAAQWRRMFRSRALCVTAKEFAAELADAFEVNAVVEFRKKYRECSLLTLDDIDSLAGRSAAQIELVYTLDALVDRGTQVVLTASVPPARLNQLHPTLVSRIGEGLAVGLAPPCVEVRTALWRRFAQLRQVELPEPVARILAEGVRGTVSDLQTAFAELEPAARLDRGHIDACWARKFIHSRSADRQPPLSAIATRTARHFTLHLADLRGPSRRRAIVTARNIAMYLARQLTDHSLDHIGTYFGGRDHTTVLHGCRKTENLLKSDPLTQQAIDRIRRKWDNAG